MLGERGSNSYHCLGLRQRRIFCVTELMLRLEGSRGLYSGRSCSKYLFQKELSEEKAW